VSDGFHPATSASVLAFLVLVVSVLGALLWMIQRAYRSWSATAAMAAGLGAWLGMLAALVATGRLDALPEHGLPIFFGSILIVWTAIAFSPIGGRVAAAVPIPALVAFQAFRLPLELVLHAWAAQGTIPDVMTWTGENWDIVTGIVAIACAPFARRTHAAAWIANVVGIVLLVNVMRVAMLAAPVTFGWHLAQPLLVALHLPYSLIGPVCFGGALFGHLVLTRALLAGQPVESNS